MGEKYLNRYKKYFRDPEIREFDMQHEQWLFGGEGKVIARFEPTVDMKEVRDAVAAAL